MAKTRTFIAISPSNEIRGRAVAAIEQLQMAGADIKWVDKVSIHWTLQFLGDLEDQELVEVCRHVQIAANDHGPFSLVAQGVRAFPSVMRPRTLWMGAGEGGELLCDLQAACSNRLREMGFREERRPFVPHLTLGRLGRGRANLDGLIQQLTTMGNFDGQSMVVDEVTVQASYLEKSGPSYQVLSRISL